MNTFILDGNEKGSGGHGPGRNTPDKDSFPPDWSDDKTIEAILDVANDPASTRYPGRKGKTIVEGTRDGVDIRVIIDKTGKVNVVSDLVVLYRAAPKVVEWDKNMVEEFIRVGKWELALDEIAGAYLESGAAMPTDLFETFEKLAIELNIEDEEGLFEDVAELRAKVKASLA